jgi:predicted AlkP superfamily pyrophosphatase or phosphodiesterase
MWDPEFQAVFDPWSDREETFKPRWWGGEPIWVTAHEHGLITAAYFWVGTEAVIHGVQPDHWYPYDAAVTHEAEVDQVLAWLDLPAGERPRLINLYFDQPNGSGHRYGPTAPETRDAVKRVDAVLGRLVAGLEARGTLAKIDLVIVSDHGMADVSPQRAIRLEDFIDLSQVAWEEGGTTLHLFPRAGLEDTVYRALAGAHPHLAVYRKGEVPARFHYAGHRRVAPIVGIPDNGWMVGTEAELRGLQSGELKGAHGFDNQHPDMWGIFYAHGPSFRRGAEIGRISAVDVYQIVAAALGIEPAPNDGDPRVVGQVLVAPADALPRVPGGR